MHFSWCSTREVQSEVEEGRNSSKCLNLPTPPIPFYHHFATSSMSPLGPIFRKLCTISHQSLTRSAAAAGVACGQLRFREIWWLCLFFSFPFRQPGKILDCLQIPLLQRHKSTFFFVLLQSPNVEKFMFVSHVCCCWKTCQPSWRTFHAAKKRLLLWWYNANYGGKNCFGIVVFRAFRSQIREDRARRRRRRFSNCPVLMLLK